jgi:pimeloyl-ACP methyl ester carboxylesterase
MPFYWIKEVQGSNKVLISTPPVSGSIMRLYGLAKGLEMSVGGLQSEGVNPGTESLNSIPVIADRFLGDITGINYTHLLGYCWGGLVAYEMYLKNPIGKLILIDPPVPLDNITGDEIVEERLAHREKPKDPPPFDRIIVNHWDAANAYRPEIPLPEDAPEALIIWSADTFKKMIAQRPELQPYIWNNYASATHVFMDINQRDLFVGDNLSMIANIIEEY